MHLSLFLSSGAIAGFSSTGFLIAIAVLACVLGAEIACIGILVKKMLRAKRLRMDMDRVDEGRSHDSSYRHYGVGAMLLFGAVPQSLYITLMILAVATAVLALVFVALLVICRLRGYDFASLGSYRKAEVAESADENPTEEIALPKEAEPAEQETLVAAEESYADESEGQRQEEYTDPAEEEEEEPLAAFAEEPDASEEGESEEVVGEVQQASMPAPTTSTTTTVTVAEGEAPLADGTRPYKVVEKYVTETYKEVYKETPPAATQEQSATEAVMEKLSDILDELQKRNESDKTKDEEKEKDQDEKTVATFAVADELSDDEDSDEEDEDDDELEEGEEGGKREDDEDRDDEENDTEGDHFTGNERIIGFDEKTGCYIVAHYRKSFEAKLIQARPNIKKYYSELKNALLSYKGTKNRISWTADSFHNGRLPIAKINVKTRILELYLALDPASLEGTVYRGKDVGSKKKYADTPFQYKLRTPRKFKWAMELIQRVCEEHGLSPIDIDHVDYEQQYPFDTTENLVARNLIKEYIREEKPATTFELAPDHVPQMPQEDDSVIPANANFSWEFDNEKMVEKEEEPIPEPEPQPEPEVQDEPVAEPTPEPKAEEKSEPAASIVRETVKITEMRYTERYYADARSTYEQVVSSSEPIEAEAITAEATPIYEEDLSVDNAAADTEDVVTEVEPMEADEVLHDDSVTDDEEATAVDVWADLQGDQETEDIAEESEVEQSVEEEDVDLDGEENEDADREPVPFRPSFYANRNYQEEEEPQEDEESLEVAEDVTDEAFEEVSEEVLEEEPEIESEEESEPQPEPVRKRIVNPGVAVVDICSLEEDFPSGSVINLETLKAKGLILPTATTLKIYAGGALSTSYTVEANHFTLDAITAISEADGDVVMIR